LIQLELEPSKTHTRYELLVTGNKNYLNGR